PVGVPLTHISGLQGGMIFVFGMGGHMILMERFDPGEMIALIEEQRVTHLGCVPTMMVAISAHPRARIADWSSVKAVMVGGAAAPAEVQARFQEITGVIVQPGYGATETSLGAVMGPADGDRDLDAAGQPLPGTTIEIRQTDDPSRIVDRGEIGEICVKGPQVMQGYWNRPDATAEAMIDGFFRTGDLGRIDNQGHVHIVDRLKDMIICSGYNVYPSAVENAIYRHPAILHCVVIAVPDEYRGETVKAYAVLRPDSAVTLEDLQAFLKPYLSPMEMPKLFEVRGTLPLTTAAKLSRKALRDELDSVGA
ncbi:MAG: class I adenylate-forming enzyme family protein, partial [Methylocella sp.]